MMANARLAVDTKYCFHLLRWYFSNEVSRRERKCIPDSGQLACIFAVSEWLTAPSSTFGLLVYGVTGNGKTTLVKSMRHMFNYLKVPDPIPDSGSSPTAGVWLVTGKELYEMYSSDPGRFKRCKETFLLAIDDLGTEEVDFYRYGNHYTPVVDLLSFRYDRMLPTIVTTNLPLKLIRKRYGDRLADRFNEMMHFVHMPDINFRDIEK